MISQSKEALLANTTYMRKTEMCAHKDILIEQLKNIIY